MLALIGTDMMRNDGDKKNGLYQHLPKLANLELIVESGSFKTASTRARVTQSALSQNISALENFFGYRLLIREGGTVQANQACLALLERVRPVIRTLDKLFSEINKDGSGVPEIGSLDLGTYESLAIDMLPPLTHRLKSLFPNLHLTVKISRSGELLRLVRKGELSAAITVETDAMDGLSVMPIAEDRLGVFVAAGHPLASMGRKALSEIMLGSLLPTKEGHPRYFARYLRTAGLSKPAVLSESFEALRAMSAAGAIAAILPARVAYRPKATPLCELDLGSGLRSGGHKIVLASPRNFDRKKIAFLAGELSNLFSDHEETFNRKGSEQWRQKK
jgi:DNA-binding transcriptional LysR family regulator